MVQWMASVVEQGNHQRVGLTDRFIRRVHEPSLHLLPCLHVALS